MRLASTQRRHWACDREASGHCVTCFLPQRTSALQRCSGIITRACALCTQVQQLLSKGNQLLSSAAALKQQNRMVNNVVVLRKVH